MYLFYFINADLCRYRKIKCFVVNIVIVIGDFIFRPTTHLRYHDD